MRKLLEMRGKLGVVALGGALVTVTIVGLAGAQTPGDDSSGEPPPRGPFVDFCPTVEQTEAHMSEYGFDYKPTVACTADGEVVPTAGGSQSPGDRGEEESDRAWQARDKAFLQSLERSPDTDGDPTTIEAVGPEGEPVVILIQTGQPEMWKGMSPAEFAERVYP